MRIISDGNISHRLVKVRVTKQELAMLLGYGDLEATLVFSTSDGWEVEMVSAVTKQLTTEKGLWTVNDELQVRKFVHGKLVALDQHYKRIESIHMNEVSGLIHVVWIGREENQRENHFNYHRAL